MPAQAVTGSAVLALVADGDGGAGAGAAFLPMNENAEPVDDGGGAAAATGKLSATRCLY